MTVALNDTQTAMNLIRERVTWDTVFGYMRTDLPTADVALLYEAQMRSEVYDSMPEDQRILFDMLLVLWEGRTNVNVADLIRVLSDADLTVVLRAIGRSRGFEVRVEPRTMPVSGNPVNAVS